MPFPEEIIFAHQEWIKAIRTNESSARESTEQALIGCRAVVNTLCDIAGWYDFEWQIKPDSITSSSLDFMGYLRTALLECAGFPGLYGNPHFEKIRREIVPELAVF